MTIRSVLSRRFLIALVPMVLLGAGLTPALGWLEARYAKDVIALCTSLHDFDHSSMPSWTHRPDLFVGTIDPRSVGTEEYVYDAYVSHDADTDTTAHGGLLVTYYSDPDDTIPHTPEVCYRQAGSTIEAMSTIEIDLGESELNTARVLDISQENGRARLVVVYVILHNGETFYERERVRLAMGWPGDRYTYFAKVEAAVGVGNGVSRDQAVETACQLLAESFVPLREHHFPLDSSLR